MSIVVYLNPDIIEQEGLIQKHEGIYGLKGSSRISIQIDREGYLVYLISSEFLAPEKRIPQFMAAYVDWVIMRKEFLNTPRRHTGRYDSGETFASLEYHPKDNGWLVANVQGKTMEEVDALYRLIRSGNAEPTEIWDNTQEGTAAVCAPPRNSIRFSQDEADKPPKAKVVDLSTHFQSPRRIGGS